MKNENFIRLQNKSRNCENRFFFTIEYNFLNQKSK